MDKLWLITNPHSGSAAPEKCAAIEAACEERGLSWAGRTRFPDEPLPGPETLTGVDTVVLFAGDGTINAAARRLERWGGQVLILPGGTMNMLAKRLHGDANPHAIIHAAHERSRTVPLPYVEAGEHCAFVGIIAGPVTAWAEAREAMRAAELTEVPGKAAQAWAASWDGAVTLHDGDALLGHYRSVFVEAREGGLCATGIAADHLTDLARLGWSWLTGDWRQAGNVDTTLTPSALLTSEGGVSALVDGEPVQLESPATLRAGVSELKFVITL
jgi:diacylglycerol kinase family enzyme